MQMRPFEPDWWLWLALTGFSIGLTTSIKWIGLFVTTVVGLYTIEDLWEKFGDLRMPVVGAQLSCKEVNADAMQRTYFWHWAARSACLIILPFCVYATMFKIHFLILNHSGPGDAQMPSLFQANLEGNNFARNPLGEERTRSF